jgi:hypothetical protein
MNDTERNTARALTLADDMADALSALGEPFPIVRDCVRAGQNPQALVDSMRPILADLMHHDAMDWILSCEWPDTDEYEIRNLSDIECLAAVEVHYEGGILGFAMSMDR